MRALAADVVGVIDPRPCFQESRGANSSCKVRRYGWGLRGRCRSAWQADAGRAGMRSRPAQVTHRRSPLTDATSSRPPWVVDGQTRTVRFERETVILGGIARRSDLRRMGLDDETVRLLVAQDRLVRVRQAWYALPDADVDAVRACGIGGRLACASALRFHGEHVDDDGVLHVELPANAVRRGLEDGGAFVRVHQPRRPSSGNRAVVDLDAARRQWERCGRAGR